MSSFAFDHPDEALVAWADRVAVIDQVDDEAHGLMDRVMAGDAVADRDSPAADVSAMDGYAVRMSDVRCDRVKIAGECAAGSPRIAMPASGVLKIFTGGVVPVGAEAVVKVEDATMEDDTAGDDTVVWRSDLSLRPGQHIRRRGENIAAGSVVARGGTLVSAAAMATLANFGSLRCDVLRRVHVGVITTGGEVLPVGQTPAEHQLRNSNSPAITAALSRGWIDVVRTEHCDDDPRRLTDLLRDVVADCDAVILTGGVSMGDHDYVPRCVAAIGGRTVFHKLPIRPGKPILAAVTDGGKMICGLPGNPVSAVVNTHRMVLPMLRRIAGIDRWMPSVPRVSVGSPDDKSLPLYHMRLAAIGDDGSARYVATKGSGDLVSLAGSDGFVEIPPGQGGAGPFRFWAWG